MKKGKSETRLPIIGGDGGIRTLDLTDANRTLSQLRGKYFPHHAKKIPYIREKYKRKEK